MRGGTSVPTHSVHDGPVAKLADQLFARKIRQTQVDQRDIDPVFIDLCQLQCERRRRRFDHLIAHFIKGVRGDHRDERFIFHQQRTATVS